ncbi:IclR family transcriptional regulator [soil metagenome]
MDVQRQTRPLRASTGAHAHAMGPTRAGTAVSPMARWLTVLEAFTEQAEWGIRDLASATGLSRSSVHRIVSEMGELGLLAPAATTGRSEVGPTLLRLAVGLTEGADVLRAAAPILDDLRDATGETAILTLYDPGRRQFRAVTASESAHPIRYIWGSLRDWSDVHLGASGKGILAFLPESEQERVLAHLPEPAAGARRVTGAQLRQELRAAARDGWVISHGERFAGAVGVAAPIRDAAGRVIGDVLLGWPDNRTDAAKELAAARAAMRAAERLSAALGYSPDRPHSARD